MFTKQQFETLARHKSSQNNLSTILNENRKFTRSTSDTTIFLSHSHKDNDYVRYAKVFLKT